MLNLAERLVAPLVARRRLKRLWDFVRPFSGGCDGFFKIGGVEPAFGSHRVSQMIVPNSRSLDIEFHIQFFVDCLNSVARHCPLFSEPIDIPMQHHFISASHLS